MSDILKVERVESFHFQVDMTCPSGMKYNKGAYVKTPYHNALNGEPVAGEITKIVERRPTKVKYRIPMDWLRVVIKITAVLLLLCPVGMSAQTIAKGEILANEPYIVLIEHINRDNGKEWIRWDIWEYLNEYEVKADSFMRITALFISQCNGDTLAIAHFNGGLSREVIKQPITLDGSTYELGTNLYNR